MTYAFFLWVCTLFTVFTNSLAEYNVKLSTKDMIVSHLIGNIPLVKGNILAFDIKFNVSLNSMKGTILSIIDPINKQLKVCLSIVDESDGSRPFMEIVNETPRFVKTAKLKYLCDCEFCMFTPLVFVVKTENSKLLIECNSRHWMKIEIPYDTDIDPINQNQLYKISFMNNPGENFLNKKYLTGCVFSISNFGKPMEQLETVGNVLKNCTKVCVDGICNGGICLETYDNVLCNCSHTFGSGSRCEQNSAKFKNKFTGELEYQCFKISWHIDATDIYIFVLEAMDTLYSVKIDKGNLVFIQQNRKDANPMMYTLTGKYQENKIYVLTLSFDKELKLELLSEIARSSLKINHRTNKMPKNFNRITLNSGNGTMDIACKTRCSDPIWKQLDLTTYQSEDLSTTHSPRTTNADLSKDLTMKPYKISESLDQLRLMIQSGNKENFKHIIIIIIILSIIILLLLIKVFWNKCFSRWQSAHDGSRSNSIERRSEIMKPGINQQCRAVETERVLKTGDNESQEEYNPLLDLPSNSQYNENIDNKTKELCNDIDEIFDYTTQGGEDQSEDNEYQTFKNIIDEVRSSKYQKKVHKILKDFPFEKKVDNILANYKTIIHNVLERNSEVPGYAQKCFKNAPDKDRLECLIEFMIKIAPLHVIFEKKHREKEYIQRKD